MNENQPATTIPQGTRDLILDLYKNKYFGSNITHFMELLDDLEDIKVSAGTIRSLLRKAFILSPTDPKNGISPPRAIPGSRPHLSDS